MISTILIHQDINVRNSEAEKILETLGFSKNHPDLLWLSEEEKLGIEQARKIQQFLGLKSYKGQGQAVVLVAAENLTTEAQNALLKTIEEPLGEVTFILGASSEDDLLPTIISRCQVKNLSSKEISQDLGEKYKEDIKKLIGLSWDKRFQFIEKLEEREAFLNALTSYFRNQLLSAHLTGFSRELQPNGGSTNKELEDFLKDLMEAQKWAKQNVNIRAILEYLMLKMPLK